MTLTTSPVTERHAMSAPLLVTEIPGPGRAPMSSSTSGHLPEPAAGLPAGAGPRRGLRHRGHRRQPLPRLLGGYRRQLHGHAHPVVVEAIRRQAGELIHYSASDFFLPIYAELCDRLAGIAPISGRVRAYLGNSGAEVVEASIKLAKYATHRPTWSRSWVASTAGPMAP